MMSTGIMEALEARGLDVEVADRMGFASVRRDGTDWLVIPCLRDGRMVRRKLRTLSGDKRFSQDGERPIPWNEDILRDDSLVAQPLVITEGELDALTAVQCGFVRTISVPDGAPMESTENPFDQKRYQWVLEIKPWLERERVQTVILATDADGPGLALRHDLAKMLGRFRCKFLTYPTVMAAGGERRLKDLNEVLSHLGQAGVVELINAAEFIQSDGVYRMSDLPELPTAAQYSAGFDMLDRNYRVRFGDFSVITGIPSHGKSAFVNDYFCRQIISHGFRILWASFEQEPQRDHRRALRTWFNELPERDQTPGQRASADAWIDKHHRFVVAANEDDVTLDWLMDKLEQAVVQHDCQVVVVDPWNEMDHLRDRDETETEYVGRSIKRLKRFAKAFDVHLAVVAHPTKLRPTDNGRIPMPTLYDISGSSHWNNKADIGIIVHREDETNTLVKVAKSRYHSQIGVPGTVRMHFCQDDLHYREWERVS